MMMRKIKRISHLQKEQQRLRREGRDMERTIRQDWQTICRGLQPATLAREALSSCTAWIGKKILSR
jgi:hypothetical protein